MNTSSKNTKRALTLERVNEMLSVLDKLGSDFTETKENWDVDMVWPLHRESECFNYLHRNEKFRVGKSAGSLGSVLTMINHAGINLKCLADSLEDEMEDEDI